MGLTLKGIFQLLPLEVHYQLNVKIRSNFKQLYISGYRMRTTDHRCKIKLDELRFIIPLFVYNTNFNVHELTHLIRKQSVLGTYTSISRRIKECRLYFENRNILSNRSPIFQSCSLPSKIIIVCYFHNVSIRKNFFGVGYS